MQIKKSWRAGISFGLTSGIITTLGMIIGLYSGTQSRLAVLASILTIAFADSLSDSLGIHISQESQHPQDHSHVWEATLAAFFSKTTLTLSFAIPVIFFPLTIAIPINIIWGLTIMILINYLLARNQDEPPLPIILEHLAIAIIVIIGSHLLGQLIKLT